MNKPMTGPELDAVIKESIEAADVRIAQGWFHCYKCGIDCATADDSECPNSRVLSRSHDWRFVRKAGA